LATGAIRVSFGWASDETDVEAFAQAMARTLAGLRRKGR